MHSFSRSILSGSQQGPASSATTTQNVGIKDPDLAGTERRGGTPREVAGASNVPDFDSHDVLCITVWELNSGKLLYDVRLRT